MANSSRARGAAVADNFEERRVDRQALILRVALICSADRAHFSLVKNISPLGLQVKLFGRFPADAAVTIRVGDEEPLLGRVAWVEQPHAGIEFEAPVDPDTLLRIAQKGPGTRRRSLPRATAMARATIRTNGRTYGAELRDISASGAKLRTGTIKSLGPAVILTIPDLPPMNAFVRWTDDEHVGLSFATPLPIQIIAGWLDDRVRVSA